MVFIEVLPSESVSNTVKGLTAATWKVKELQNDLALKQLGKIPDLQSFNTFHVAGKKTKSKEMPFISVNQENEYERLFEAKLQKIKDNFKEFPFYFLEMMAFEFNIPYSEAILMFKEVLYKKILILLPNGNYKFMV